MRNRTALLVLLATILVALATTSPWRTPTALAQGNTNGVGGSMPAFYDHREFTINFKEFTSSEGALIAKNHQTNQIWQSDPGLPGGAPFIAVIDAIPGDGMNPLWLEVQIRFTAGHTPRQLYSDDEIAQARTAGEIVCTPTGELYRCSVIGPPPPPSAAALVSAHATSFASVNATLATGAATSTTWGQLKRMYR
jgi:hypothetical protein